MSWRWMATTCGPIARCARRTFSGCWRAGRKASMSPTTSKAKSALILPRDLRARLRGPCVEALRSAISGRALSPLDQGQEPGAPRLPPRHGSAWITRSARYRSRRGLSIQVCSAHFTNGCRSSQGSVKSIFTLGRELVVINQRAHRRPAPLHAGPPSSRERSISACSPAQGSLTGGRKEGSISASAPPRLRTPTTARRRDLTPMAPSPEVSLRRGPARNEVNRDRLWPAWTTSGWASSSLA